MQNLVFNYRSVAKAHGKLGAKDRKDPMVLVSDHNIYLECILQTKSGLVLKDGSLMINNSCYKFPKIEVIQFMNRISCTISNKLYYSFRWILKIFV